MILLLLTSACSNSEQRLAQDLERASQLEQEGKLQDAITLLQTLNDRHPGRTEILEPLAFAYSRTQQYDFAAFTFAEIAEISGNNNMFHLQAAEHALLAGDEESSIRHYKNFLQHNQQDAHAWEQLGKLQQSRNFYQDAADSFMRKYKLEPTGSTALQIGQTFLALGNLTQAERWFQTARESGREYEKEALIGLVETSFASNQTAKLEAHLETLKNNYPDALNNENIRVLSEQLAQFQTERDALNKMLQGDNSEESGSTSTGTSETATEVASTETGEITESVAAEETEVTISTENRVEETTSMEISEGTESPKIETAAEIVVTEQQVGGAKEDLPQDMLAEVEATLQEEAADPATTATAETEPETPVSHAEMLEDSFEEPQILEALTVLPEEASLLEQARFEYRSGNHQRASELYWNHLANDNADPEVWRELSNAFLNQEQYRPARAAALEAIRRDPQNLVYIFQHLRVVQKTESPERFLQELQNTRRRFPRSPDVSLALARTYDKAFNDPSNSQFYYHEFLRLSDSEHPSRNEANEALGLPLEE